MPGARLMELLERLANLLQREARTLARANGLADAVHLAAILYLAKANRYSNTPAALAEYLGLTKGTVSQTLALLERQGFARKRRDRADGRVVRLSLTRKGERLAGQFLRRRLFGPQAEAWPEEAALEAELESLLRRLQRAHGGRSFGVCRTCRHFRQHANRFQCGLTGEPLSQPQIVRICREHEAITPAA